MNLGDRIPRAWAEGFFAVGHFLDEPDEPSQNDGPATIKRPVPREIKTPVRHGRWCPHGRTYRVRVR